MKNKILIIFDGLINAGSLVVLNYLILFEVVKFYSFGNGLFSVFSSVISLPLFYVVVRNSDNSIKKFMNFLMYLISFVIGMIVISVFQISMSSEIIMDSQNDSLGILMLMNSIIVICISMLIRILVCIVFIVIKKQSRK